MDYYIINSVTDLILVSLISFCTFYDVYLYEILLHPDSYNHHHNQDRKLFLPQETSCSTPFMVRLFLQP